jgi:hypothetical protein
MKGYLLRKVETITDLEAADLDFWVKSSTYGYDIRDFIGAYVDMPDSETEFEPVEEVQVKYAFSINVKAFVEDAKVYKDKDGNLYITDEEVLRHC